LALFYTIVVFICVDSEIRFYVANHIINCDLIMIYLNSIKIIHSSTDIPCCNQTLYRYNLEHKQTITNFNSASILTGGTL